MIRRLLIAALAALTGCASRGAGAPSTPAVTGLPLQELPAQTLDKGQCGLFLWARSEPPQRVFMALNTPALARVRIAGRTVDLPRTSFGGEAAFGHHPEQRFAGDGVTLTASLEIEARGALIGGAVVRAGTLTFETISGDSTVLPVAGLVACQS